MTLLGKSIAVAGVLLAGQTALHTWDIEDRFSMTWREWFTPANVKKESVWLNNYQLEAMAEIPEVQDNLSGLTYNPETASFWAILNSPQRLLELDENYQIVRTVTLKNFTDTEALSFAGNGQMVIADERDQSIVIAVIDDYTTELDKHELKRVTLNTGGGNNKGFEGIAVNSRDDIIYVVRERDPMRLLTVHGLLQDGSALRIEEHPEINVNKLPIDDLSGLFLDDITGNLLLLSDESMVLAEVTPDGKTISYLELDSGFHGLTTAVPQAEGIAIGPDRSIHIVSEPNLIYRFERKL